MSVATEYDRLLIARNAIRQKLVELSLAAGTEGLTQLANQIQALVTATAYDGPGQNTNGYMTQKAATDALNNSHKQFLQTFAATEWALQSSGTWSGYYKQTLTGKTIYNTSGNVRASGSALDTPPASGVKSMVAGMYFEIDDTANTLTAYAKSAPGVTVYVSVEGVQ